jgi:membrane-bound metal-dependent hydrolase YbcI (DUF457 family)
MTGRVLTLLGIFVLNFIGTIFLESKLQEFFKLELAIVVVGILLAVIALVGIAAEARWAWPFSTILFSLILANAVFLYVNVPATITFLGLLFVNVIGLMIAILSIEDAVQAASTWSEPSVTESENMVPLETYEAVANPQVSYKTGAAKATRKRKK